MKQFHPSKAVGDSALKKPGPGQAVPTLQDVAQAAGVAKATASRVLSGKTCVSVQTADRVRKAAEELGYQADPLVSSWARDHWRKRADFTGIAAAFVHFPCAPGSAMTPGLIESVQEKARHLGYQVDVINAAEYATSRQLDHVLQSRGVQALILYSLNCPEGWFSLDWNQYSVVACDVGYYIPPVHLVTRNHFQLARLAYARAHEAGYRRIGCCIQSGPPTFDHEELLAGFRQEQSHYEDDDSSIPPYHGDFSHEKPFMEWYLAHRPDAVLSNCPITYWWLKNSGVLERDRVGFVSLNEAEGSPVSGMVLDHLAMAAQSLDLLDQCVRTHQKGLPARCLRVNIDPLWNEGTTLPPVR